MVVVERELHSRLLANDLSLRAEVCFNIKENCRNTLPMQRTVETNTVQGTQVLKEWRFRMFQTLVFQAPGTLPTVM